MSGPDAFEPVTIGISPRPRGVVWTAYRPEDVEPMRRKLRALWEDHALAVRIDCRCVEDLSRRIPGVRVYSGRTIKGKPAALRAFAAAIRANPPAEWVGHDPLYVAEQIERAANIERVTG